MMDMREFSNRLLADRTGGRQTDISLGRDGLVDGPALYLCVWRKGWLFPPLASLSPSLLSHERIGLGDGLIPAYVVCLMSVFVCVVVLPIDRHNTPHPAAR
uniref:Uncharacterized protein n=1 Tax=Vitrella brassicaformis TaxID=1169539 RepID=A0A7S1KHQ3_9ALVE|mmetsp:Transcript_5681/g.13543  ORF Transcript_5681/g.13543 Transcript_5681/m.13543 type:complete len:101 (+) Transcript_5681:315-617(+)